MRFSTVVMAYFICGALMWGGGIIVWGEAGVGTIVLDQQTDGGFSANETTGEQVEKSGGPIQEAADTVSGGGLLAAWSLVVNIFSYLFWPVTVLVSVNAPARVTVLAGGTLALAMLVGIIRVIRSGA